MNTPYRQLLTAPRRALSFTFLVVMALASLLSLFPLSSILTRSVLAAGPTVTVVGSTTTIRPNDALPSPTNVASITAAQNEFESFQIVVQAGDSPINGFRAQASNLVGPGGAVISAASNITLYREAYYNVTTPSRNGPTGPWPDALIPDVDPYYGEQRNAFVNYNIPANGRVVVWVDVLVPNPKTPGLYNGNIALTGQGFANEVAVNLTVLNFAIPSTSTLDSAFMIQDHSVLCKAHYNDQTCANDEFKQWGLHSLYARAALENRITLARSWYLGKEEGPVSAAKKAAFDRYILPLIQGTSPQDSAGRWKPVRLASAMLTSLGIYGYENDHCLEVCLAQWKTFAEQRGFAARMFVYGCDEPGVTQTKWTNCTNRGTNARNTWPGLTVLVTAAIQNAKLYGDTTKIDLLVPLINSMDGKVAFQNVPPGNQRREYDDFLAQDPTLPPNRLWMYTSCMSYGCNPGANNDSLSTGWAGYAIDAAATEARAMGWLTFEYDVSGELYYDVARGLATAWNNDLFREGANGDGTLFYPGTPAQIGGTHDIPVESLRLKRIRDGREDYEYLYILKQRGKAAEALQVARTLFPTTHDADKSQADVDQARAELIRLLGAAAPADADLAISISDRPDPVALNGRLTYTLVVTNQGPATATNVVLTDMLPNSVNSNTNGSFPGGTCPRDGQVVTCRLGTLNSGASVTVTIPDIEVYGQPRTMTNTASVQADQSDALTSDNTDAENTTVQSTVEPTATATPVPTTAPTISPTTASTTLPTPSATALVRISPTTVSSPTGEPGRSRVYLPFIRR